VRCAELATASGDFIEAFDQTLPERDLFAAPVIGFLVDDISRALKWKKLRSANKCQN